eukprot:4047705-Amphidinium_carterae.1
MEVPSCNSATSSSRLEPPGTPTLGFIDAGTLATITSRNDFFASAACHTLRVLQVRCGFCVATYLARSNPPNSCPQTGLDHDQRDATNTSRTNCWER